MTFDVEFQLDDKSFTLNDTSAAAAEAAAQRAEAAAETVSGSVAQIAENKNNISSLKEELEELVVIPTAVRMAIYRLLNAAIYAADADKSTDIAILESWSQTHTTSITLSQSSINFNGEGTETLIATLVPADSTDTVVWVTSNSSPPTVENGVVTAVSDGSCTITAIAGTVSASCSVTVTGISYIYYDYCIGQTNNSNTIIDTGIVFTPSASVYDIEFKYLTTESITEGVPIMGGRNASSSTGNNAACTFMLTNKWFVYHLLGLDARVEGLSPNVINTVKYNFSDGSPTILDINGTETTVATISKSSVSNNTKSFVLFGQNRNGTLNASSQINKVQLGEIKISDQDGNLVYDFVPATERSTGKNGFHETVHDVFYGKSSTYISVGNWT
jgi:hypothetical protein